MTGDKSRRRLDRKVGSFLAWKSQKAGSCLESTIRLQPIDTAGPNLCPTAA